MLTDRLVPRCEESYLLVGTSTGHLQIHTDEGLLLHRQRLHAGPVTAITLRAAGMRISCDDTSEDATVCFEDAVACISSIEVQCSFSQCFLAMMIAIKLQWSLQSMRCRWIFGLLQMQSLVYIRATVGPAGRWPQLGFNKWDTSRSAGGPPRNDDVEYAMLLL